MPGCLVQALAILFAALLALGVRESSAGAHDYVVLSLGGLPGCGPVKRPDRTPSGVQPSKGAGPRGETNDRRRQGVPATLETRTQSRLAALYPPAIDPRFEGETARRVLPRRCLTARGRPGLILFA